MEATTSRADTTVNRSSARQPTHRAHGHAAPGGSALQGDTADGPAFAQLLGQRIGKALDASPEGDDPLVSDADEREADIQDKLASPPAEGTAAWWVERSRAVANDPAQRVLRHTTADRDESTIGVAAAQGKGLAHRAGTPLGGTDGAPDEGAGDKPTGKPTGRDAGDTTDTGAIRLLDTFPPASTDPIDLALPAPIGQPPAAESTESAPDGSAGRQGTEPNETPSLDALASAVPLPSPEATRLTAPGSGFNPLPTREIRPSPGTPAFAPALGHEVRMLVRDGVQEARLQLNPVDMGPVMVKIALDGDSARVDFVADALATREAIEAAMSQLADALRESGLAFSGGDVSSESGGAGRGGRGAGDDAPSPGRSVRGGVDSLAQAGTAVPLARVQRGAVDLYA